MLRQEGRREVQAGHSTSQRTQQAMRNPSFSSGAHDGISRWQGGAAAGDALAEKFCLSRAFPAPVQPLAQR
eukprot:16449227-Heterocapsa_arctica.AAC.1